MVVIFRGSGRGICLQPCAPLWQQLPSIADRLTPEGPWYSPSMVQRAEERGERHRPSVMRSPRFEGIDTVRSAG
jgi:hypothetical protein